MRAAQGIMEKGVGKETLHQLFQLNLPRAARIPRGRLLLPIFLLIYFQSGRDVAEFQPVAVADDEPAPCFDRQVVDVSPVAAGAVRQDEIAVGGERKRRMEIGYR